MPRGKSRKVSGKRGKRVTGKRGKRVTSKRGKRVTSKRGKRVSSKKGKRVTSKRGKKVMRGGNCNCLKKIDLEMLIIEFNTLNYEFDDLDKIRKILTKNANNLNEGNAEEPIIIKIKNMIDKILDSRVVRNITNSFNKLIIKLLIMKEVINNFKVINDGRGFSNPNDNHTINNPLIVYDTERESLKTFNVVEDGTDTNCGGGCSGGGGGGGGGGAAAGAGNEGNLPKIIKNNNYKDQIETNSRKVIGKVMGKVMDPKLNLSNY
jgi:hypothetical protein